MKLNYKSLLSGFLAAAISLALTGCGGDSKSTVTGPSGGGFAGSTITIPPTITFTDATNCSYTNAETGSPFPFSAAPVTGTYTYAPSADFTSGTLTLSLGAPISDDVVLTIRNFVQSGGNVTGFRAVFNGRTFPVTVTGGTILAQVINNNGGGGGLEAGETVADPIPDTMQGTYSLVFFESTSGSGINDGATTNFTITADTLVFGSKTLKNPVFINGNDLEWIFKDGAIWYAASIAIDNGLNEINVGGPGGTPFYGQYREASATTTVTDNQLSSGTTLSAVVGGNFVSLAYPESGPTLNDGDTVNFTIGDGTASFGSFTGLVFDSANSNEFAAVYTEDLGNGESNLVSFGYNTAGNTTYVTNIRITFARKVEPTDGQAKEATFFLGDITN